MEEIINSVMQSPENTNPNVLRGQLQTMGGSSGSGGGWTKEDTTELVLNETVTGSGGQIEGAYLATLDNLVTIDSGTVTFNGTEYTVEKRVGDVGGTEAMIYGAEFTVVDDTPSVDFSDYPFCIMTQTVGDYGYSMVVMQTEGPNTIKVETVVEKVVPTEDFKSAVVNIPLWLSGELGEYDENGYPIITVDMTMVEIYEKGKAGTLGVKCKFQPGHVRGIFTLVRPTDVSMIMHDLNPAGGHQKEAAVLYRGTEDAETGKTIFAAVSDAPMG